MRKEGSAAVPLCAQVDTQATEKVRKMRDTVSNMGNSTVKVVAIIDFNQCSFCSTGYLSRLGRMQSKLSRASESRAVEGSGTAPTADNGEP